MKAWVIGVLLLLSAGAAVQASENLKAFPPAGKGMVRHVLNLPSREDEPAFRVELIVGKTAGVDNTNSRFFSGTIRAETIKGRGYTRYKVDKLGVMACTRMAVDPRAPCLIRYNSRLPAVVCVPEGVELRCRIWAAGAEEGVIEQG